MGILLRVVMTAMGLWASGCAVAHNRSFAVKEDPVLLDSQHLFHFRVQNSGAVNAFWREPLLIPFVAYVDYQGPPFLVTLEIRDDENRLETVLVNRVVLLQENGEQEDLPVPQAFCSFRDEGGGRKAVFPVLENLGRHEPLEVRVDIALRKPDGTEVEFQISGRLVPETRQGMTDAVTFTIFGIT